ncbi:MAG: hypothetical protein O7G88_08630 [bacterium]|nr:hypothetical protein [bacterium]
MNLFRSEEHARQWALYDAAYDANLQSLAAYMERFSGERFRARIRPDYISWLRAQP